MKRHIFSTAFLTIASLIAMSPTALAARATTTSSSATTTALGMDISWPQCGKRVPNTQVFGVVGVNGGLATTTNSCLKDQLVWAKQSTGKTIQDKVQLYVNTANPGGLNTDSWPKSNVDPAGNMTTANPYGTCDGSDSLACAWQYGWNRSLEDVRDRFQPAAAQAAVATSPASYIWWLDVETQNTWKPSGNTFNTQSNVADLEGMTAYFTSLGGRVGLYSTAAQWQQIVGSSVSASSNLNGLTNWRPGGANLSTAKDACKAAPLTANGKVVLTQYISKSLDYDYSCV
jgi:hypothetical protein